MPPRGHLNSDVGRTTDGFGTSVKEERILTMAITFTKKILIMLGIGGLSFVVLIVVFIGLAFYLSSDLESDKVFQRESQAKQVEGRELGKTTDQQGCMREGLTRAKTMSTFEFKRGQINSAFVSACLESSRPAAGFCDGIPQRSFTAPSADYDWITEQCDKIGMDHVKTGCIAVFQTRIKFCHDH